METDIQSRNVYYRDALVLILAVVSVVEPVTPAPAAIALTVPRTLIPKGKSVII